MNAMLRLLTVYMAVSTAGLAAAEDYGFFIQHADLKEHNRELKLDADIDIRLSEDAIEALKHGVPMTITVQLKVVKKRKYIWDKTMSDVKLAFRIHYHALVKLFQIINENSGVYRNFAILDSAIEALGTIRGIPVMTVDKLDKRMQYLAKLKVSLDIEALPLPLRPVAYVSSSWNLDSSWYVWPLEN